MGVSEVAAQGGGPTSVPSDTSSQGDHSTGDGKSFGTGAGGPIAVGADTHTVGDHSTGTGRNGTPGGEGGPMSVPATPGLGGSPPDTSR